jgi:hypothetical protein
LCLVISQNPVKEPERIALTDIHLLILWAENQSDLGCLLISCLTLMTYTLTKVTAAAFVSGTVVLTVQS